MIGFFRSILGKNSLENGKNTGAESLAQMEARGTATASPAADSGVFKEEDDGAEGEQSSVFLCREAILGRNQRIIGYEFSHPQRLHSRLNNRAVVRRYYDGVLLEQLASMRLESIIGQQFAVLDISPITLDHPSLENLPRDNVALTLAFPEKEVSLSAQMVAEAVQRAQGLRKRGIRIGLKWQRRWPQETEWFDLLQHLDFAQLSWLEYADQGARLVDFRQKVKQINATIPDIRPKPIRLIASDLNAPDDFRECYRLGFDFFRGPFITRKQERKTKKSAVNRLRIIQLLNNLRRDAGTHDLEKELKQDPALSYHLLRYTNSPALGLRQEITSLSQAIIILGRDNLYRWLSFLLLRVEDPGYHEWVLTEQALARAALMERLGHAQSQQDISQDSLFLTGLFSLLDQLMGFSLEQLTSQIHIPEEICDALVHRKGVLAQYLALAEACESMVPENIEYRSSQLGFSAAAVNLAVFDALAWAHEMSNINEPQSIKSPGREAGQNNQ